MLMSLRPHRHADRRAFTLVEILIVVVILGLLAAIALPQFTSASETARANSTASILKSLRAQLELYNVHHEDYPELDQLWDSLLSPTDNTGQVIDDGPLGPYLQKPPLNPYTNSSEVAEFGSGTESDGWEYDENNGEIRAVGFDESTGDFTKPES